MVSPAKRVQVTPNLSPPYAWIGFLQIEDADGKLHFGSGFKINFPDAKHTIIVTSADNVYSNRRYASKISVTFPGQPTITAKSSDLYTPSEYSIEKGGNQDYNYGLILLQGSSDEGFGWTTQLSDDHMKNRTVTNCGYPGDKPAGSMWITGGEVTSYTSHCITYKNEAAGVQSGSPIYTWYGGYWTVIGVQSSDKSVGARFTIEMISNFVKKLQYPIKKLESVTFSNIFVRCRGTAVKEFQGSGSGLVNCQYGAGSSEQFYIYPPEMPPSLATDCKTPHKVVIESAKWNGVYIRLDGTGINQFLGSGGGTVNCQYGANIYETFYLKEEDKPGVYSIVSAAFPHCRIRVHGQGVTKLSGPGGGTVNCQYYDNVTSPAMDLEKIEISDFE